MQSYANTVELQCPKCANKSAYYARFDAIQREGKTELRLINRISCNMCKAVVAIEGTTFDGDVKLRGPTALGVYDYAKKFAIARGYEDELKWLSSLLEKQMYKTMSSRDFFREYAWVVFASGFKADTVRSKWKQIESALCGFYPQKVAQLTLEILLERSPIKNKQKLAAILASSKKITDDWIAMLRSASPDRVKEEASKLPFIGEVTIWHIIRNLGIDCFKPDRHIENLASALSVDAKNMFDVIIEAKKEKFIGVADYVLWRACATLGSARALIDATSSGKDPSKSPRKDDGITAFLF